MHKKLKKIIKNTKWYRYTDHYRSRYIEQYKREGGLEQVRWVGECWNEKLGEYIPRLLQQHLTPEQLKDRKLYDCLFDDILKSFLIDGFAPAEYFTFDLMHKSRWQRRKYLGQIKKYRILDAVIGNKRGNDELNDKYYFYQLCQPYFHREVCRISSDDNQSDFIAFCERHPSFILKPNDECIGSGIRKVQIDDKDAAIRLWKELTENSKVYVAEELIVQDPVMAQWNESSVNTVRISAFLVPDKNGGQSHFVHMHPYFRCGRKGMVVDNMGAGGMACVLDEGTGRIITDGMTSDGTLLNKCLDSGVVFKNWQVPSWNSLISLSEEIMRHLPPYHRFVGFDFAYTAEGWVLIEGNWGDFEAAQAHGFLDVKRRFKQYMLHDWE